MGACEFQFIYEPVLVYFLNTVVSSLIFPGRVISTHGIYFQGYTQRHQSQSHLMEQWKFTNSKKKKE